MNDGYRFKKMKKKEKGSIDIHGEVQEKQAVQSLMLQSQRKTHYLQQWLKTRQIVQEGSVSEEQKDIEDSQQFRNCKLKFRKHSTKQKNIESSIKFVPPEQYDGMPYTNRIQTNLRYRQKSFDKYLSLESISSEVMREGAMVFINPKLRKSNQRYSQKKAKQSPKIKFRVKENKSSIESSLILRKKSNINASSLSPESITDKLRKMSLPWIKNLPKISENPEKKQERSNQNKFHIAKNSKIKRNYKNLILRRREETEAQLVEDSSQKKISLMQISKAEGVFQIGEINLKQQRAELLKKWLNINKPKQKYKITSLLREHFQLEFLEKKKARSKKILEAMPCNHSSVADLKESK